MDYAVNKSTKEHRTLNEGESVVAGVESLVKSDENGWIKWDADKCNINPMASTERCDATLQDGRIIDDILSKCLYWGYTGSIGDIILYRPIVKPAASNILLTRGDNIETVSGGEWVKGIFITEYNDHYILDIGGTIVPALKTTTRYVSAMAVGVDEMRKDAGYVDDPEAILQSLYLAGYHK